ncbi:Xaa-Pro aminopeptidase [Lewinellaceae bacterium SD302]|nr:Xaa-Pro aminopeptidase [Lewinellaceae bacterium SD302]
MFPAQTYQDRRQNLANHLDSGLILIPGNNEAPMNYTDNVYPFRQDSSFRYFAGVNKPGFVLTIDASSGESTLYGNDVSLDHIVWMGEQPSVRELAAQAGIDKTGNLADLTGGLTATKQRVHYLPPYREERFRQLQIWLGKSRANIELGISENLVRAVIALRSIKSAEEVAQMEIAVNTTRRMHHAAMDHAAPGMLEAEVAGLIEGIAIQGDGRLAYPAIVTRNGHILHNHYHGNELKEGDLLLIDAGAETPTGYAGDITRTFCVGREMDNRQKAVYDIVKKAEEEVIADLQPGVAYRDCHAQAGRIIVSGLKNLGLMQGDPAQAVAEGAHALFMPHGLGHHIGMDVHDMEDLGEDLVGYDEEIKRSKQFGTNALRLGKKLEVGNVITVEPGIYFIPALIDRWEAEGKFTSFINYNKLQDFRDFGGIRIEDNVLITETGSRVLGEAILK